MCQESWRDEMRDLCECTLQNCVRRKHIDDCCCIWNQNHLILCPTTVFNHYNWSNSAALCFLRLKIDTPTETLALYTNSNATVRVVHPARWRWRCGREVGRVLSEFLTSAPWQIRRAIGAGEPSCRIKKKTQLELLFSAATPRQILETSKKGRLLSDDYG